MTTTGEMHRAVRQLFPKNAHIAIRAEVVSYTVTGKPEHEIVVWVGSNSYKAPTVAAIMEILRTLAGVGPKEDIGIEEGEEHG